MGGEEHYLKKELYGLIRSDPAVFSLLQGGTTDGVWFQDLERAGNVWTDERFWEALGYDPADKRPLVSEWEGLIHPDDLRTAQDNLHRHCIDPTHPYDQYVRYRHRDGSTVWMRRRGIALRDGSGRATRMLGSHTDVTGFVRLGQDMQRSAEHIRDLYNHAPCGYHSLDRDGTFLEINDTELRWLGYSRDEIVGRMQFGAVLTAESLKIFHATFPRFKAEGQVRDLEFDMVRKDGTILPVLLNATALCDAQGNYVSSRSSVFDISGRRQAEAERDRFFTLSLDLLCIAGFDGYFKRLNPAWERVFGYAIEEFLAEPYLNFIHPDDRDMTCSEAMRITSGGETFTFENRYRCRDGSYRWLLWSAVPAHDQGNIYAVARDITGRKQAEEEVSRANEQLYMANQELESFSYSVSHDLRAPLRAINGFAHILVAKHGERLGAEGRRLLDIIGRNTSKMGRLIDDLLEFSRLSRRALEPQRVDMTELARTAFAEASAAAAGRRIVFRLADLPAVSGDPAMWFQAWFNLLDNAVKYTRPRPEALIEVAGRVHDGEALFSVQDNGVGFDTRYTHKLFGVFERLHKESEFEGTGVGLALVHRVVKRHGGRVWADSTPGEGSRFEFALPIQEREHVQPR